MQYQQIQLASCSRRGAMQEHVLHIKLVNGLWVWDYQGEHCANNGRLDHQAKGLIIVNAGPLGEVTKDPTSLVPIQSDIGLELVLEDPFAGDVVGANGAHDKIPGVVGNQGSKFFFCGGVDGSYTVRG
jgi:hypothetical protein